MPPQPTEEDSSSTEPNEAPNGSNELNNNDSCNIGRTGRNSILSDSDDRHSYAFSFKLRQTSYFVSFAFGLACIKSFVFLERQL